MPQISSLGLDIQSRNIMANELNDIRNNDKIKVLIVDDERGERFVISQYLASEGYLTYEASDGEEALTRFNEISPDIVLVDVMMPRTDGFDLVRTIRKESTIPIIFVTARGDEARRIAGLELGADDYVIKPYSPGELVARVRAQLRRTQGVFKESKAGDLLKSGKISVSKDERRCFLDNNPVELTRREFDLLVTLIENEGRVCTREQLLRAAWEDSYVDPKTVDVHLAGLRRKLGSDLNVSALRGIGYRMEKQ